MPGSLIRCAVQPKVAGSIPAAASVFLADLGERIRTYCRALYLSTDRIVPLAYKKSKMQRRVRVRNGRNRITRFPSIQRAQAWGIRLSRRGKRRLIADGPRMPRNPTTVAWRVAPHPSLSVARCEDSLPQPDTSLSFTSRGNIGRFIGESSCSVLLTRLRHPRSHSPSPRSSPL